MKTSFDKHLDTVLSQGHTKIASRTTGDDFINKLAEEILGESAGLPSAENHISEVPLSSMPTVDGSGEAVMSATDAVILPAVAVAGGSIPAMLEGEMPAAVVDSGDTTTKGTGIPTDVMPKAGTDGMEAMGEEMGMTEEQVKEASYVGAVIANSIIDHLEKVAQRREYSEALEILKTAGLLDGYNIQDGGIEKTASADVSGLTKIANSQALSHEDIISAAAEYVEIQKTASAVEEQARQDAREFVRQTAEQQAIEKQAADAQAAEEALVKQASSIPEVRNAIAVLAQHGLV